MSGVVPDNAPQHCPGTGSEDAGKASACAGCPNQNICATGAANLPDPAIEIIKNRLSNVKHKILVLSGKGGVGKSTVTSLLGYALAARNSDINVGILDADICGPSQPRVLGVRGEQVHNSGSGWSPVVSALHPSPATGGILDADICGPSQPRVLGVRGEQVHNSGSGWSPVVSALHPSPATGGILDADICGPSQPRVLGVRGEQVHNSGSGWSPVYINDNLSLMSIGFLLGSPDDAVIWRGPKKNGMIKQFLSEVDWGDLDYLLIDTPPGTSDEHLSSVQYLSTSGLTGAVVVSTPQEAALLDVRKEIAFCRKLGVPVLGVVENMSLFVCPNCKSRSEIFPATTGGVSQLCADMGVPPLGPLPLDPLLARCCDQGRDFLQELPNSPTVHALLQIVDKIVAFCENSS